MDNFEHQAFMEHMADMGYSPDPDPTVEPDIEPDVIEIGD